MANSTAFSVEDATLHIGATVRHAAIESMVGGGTLGCLLREVARFVAHPPIRNRGTFCGSLAHADPAAEWCLVAATLDATILARSARGVRAIAAADFFQGVMTTSLTADELVMECRIPLLADDARFGFFEVSRRAGDFAMAAALVTYRLHDGRIAEPHIGLGGVEPFPRRLPWVEERLAGEVPDSECFRAAAAAAAARSRADAGQPHRHGFPAAPCQRGDVARAAAQPAMTAAIEIELHVNGERHRIVGRAAPDAGGCAA